MGHTLSGFTVQFGTTNAVEEYNVFGHPTAILGKSPSGLPYPFAVDANGNIIISPTGSGIPFTPPTVNGVKVVGIQETRTPQDGLTTATTTVPAGALSVTVLFSSDFVGTVEGISVTGATASQFADAANPGNTLPAIVVTRSAGTYSILTGGAT